MNLQTFIDNESPCQAWVTWTQQQGHTTVLEAWNDTTRGDWLLWIATRLGVPYKKLVKTKALCADIVRRELTREQKQLIKIALAFADGTVNKRRLFEAASNVIGERAAKEDLMQALDRAYYTVMTTAFRKMDDESARQARRAIRRRMSELCKQELQQDIERILTT